MTQQNPWLPSEGRAVEIVAPAERERRWAPGADVAVGGGLPLVHAGEATTRLWVVGAHGGAGASSWAQLLGAGDAGQAWPVCESGMAAVVVARGNRAGLKAAQRAAIQWASGAVVGVELLGLVLAPDAPGRPLRELKDFTRLVSGAFPRVWHVPWMETWRLQEPQNVERSRSTKSVVNEVTRAAQAATERK